jgi:hypothetical protein
MMCRLRVFAALSNGSAVMARFSVKERVVKGVVVKAEVGWMGGFMIVHAGCKVEWGRLRCRLQSEK